MTNEELAIRIKAGIDTADNMLQLWEQTRRFIRRIASRYVGAAELEDLEQEGYLALYDAVDGYRPDLGCKFLHTQNTGSSNGFYSMPEKTPLYICRARVAAGV